MQIYPDFRSSYVYRYRYCKIAIYVYQGCNTRKAKVAHKDTLYNLMAIVIF